MTPCVKKAIKHLTYRIKKKDAEVVEEERAYTKAEWTERTHNVYLISLLKGDKTDGMEE